MNIQYIETFVLVTHVVAAIAIIGLVLYQRGRGAEMGTGFGAGASGTVFGSAGSGNFMTRMTSTVAITFVIHLGKYFRHGHGQKPQVAVMRSTFTEGPN